MAGPSLDVSLYAGPEFQDVGETAWYGLVSALWLLESGPDATAFMNTSMPRVALPANCTIQLKLYIRGNAPPAYEWSYSEIVARFDLDQGSTVVLPTAQAPLLTPTGLGDQ